MNTDLIGSVELTASAAIVIAALSIGFGSNAPARIRIAAWLSAWFVIVAILAATRALYYERALGAPSLGIAVALPIAVLCILVACVQPLHDALHRVPLWLLVGVHTVRLLGISFVILYAAGRLPAPFAPVAGWGDIFVGATALPVARLAYRRPVNARPILWIWNVIGLVDLVAAVGLGVISSPGPQRLISAEPSSAIMTTLPWLLIPGFLVPLLFTVHIGIFIRLVSARKPAPTSA
ncbi:MAG: hypothetical protein DME87_09835 [Verrucomicrobia bacterium]|nr:MAG: hypothetical protein DME87_09835 [Verrucomicrobiota bacterium]